MTCLASPGLVCLIETNAVKDDAPESGTCTAFTFGITRPSAFRISASRTRPRVVM
jgi:hypothetical protein